MTIDERYAVLKWLTQKIAETGVPDDIDLVDFLKLPVWERTLLSFLHHWRGELAFELLALGEQDTPGGEEETP